MLNFIVSTHSAFRIIEAPELREMLETVCGKQIFLPTRKMITTELSKTYEIAHHNLKELLSKSNYVCTTADVWSHRAVAFMGVSVHFMDGELNRYSYLLALRKMERKQNYRYLAEMINQIHDEFALPITKITHVVTDGARSFCKAFQEYGRRANAIEVEHNDPEECGSDDESDFEEDTNQILDSELDCIEDFTTHNGIESNEIDFLELEDEIDTPILPEQLRCFAHLLNLIGKNDFSKWLKDLDLSSYKVFDTIFLKLKILWNGYSRRILVKEVINRYLGCSLQPPGVTRWNSEFRAAAVAVKHKEKLKIAITEVNKQDSLAKKIPLLSDSEWFIVEAYIAIMQPIANGLDKLQGDKHATIGSILPCLFYIERHLQGIELNSDRSISKQIKICGNSMKQAVINAFIHRFDNYMKIGHDNKEMIVAAMCHPAYKTKWIDSDKQELARIIFESQAREFYNSSIDAAENNDEDDDIFVRDVRRQSSGSLLIELENYFNSVTCKLSTLNSFPTIFRMFIRFNTTLSSSAPIERIFSQALLIFVGRRNRLSTQNFERALFLNLTKGFIKRICSSVFSTNQVVFIYRFTVYS